MPSIGRGAAANFPSGGTVGQFLAKNTATDFNASWATVPTSIGPYPLPVAGLYQDARVVAMPGNYNSVNFSSNTTTYVPFYVSQGFVCSEIGSYENTASGTATFGVLTATATMTPGTLLGSYTYTSTGGGFNTSFGSMSSFTMPEGWNFFALGVASSSSRSIQAYPVQYFRTPFGSAIGTGLQQTAWRASGAAPVSNPTGLTAQYSTTVMPVFSYYR